MGSACYRNWTTYQNNNQDTKKAYQSHMSGGKSARECGEDDKRHAATREMDYDFRRFV